MSQFDQIRDLLNNIEKVADRLTKQGDSEALRDFYASLTNTHNYFADYAEQQQDAIVAALKEDQENATLEFDLDGDDDHQPIIAPTEQNDTKSTIQPSKSTVTKPQSTEIVSKQGQAQTQPKDTKLAEEKANQLKKFKDIELYIGDKFTQYGCTFEKDLFTPNDPLKIGILHIQALLLILRKLGVYLTPSESTLLLTKFKPTQEQINDYINTHEVNTNNLPIEKYFVNYSLFFLYLQALNNVALTSRAVIQSNVPALMAGRALQLQPSNPHPIDTVKADAKIQGVVIDTYNNEQNQIDAQKQLNAAFNDPMAQVTLVSEHANKPKEYVVDFVKVQKLIRDFAAMHPSPSRVYSGMKKAASHSMNVTQYGENTISLDGLIEGLKTFNFKMTELPCSIDAFKKYIGLYSENNIPAVKFAEFVCFLNCEEPKNGWDALVVVTNDNNNDNSITKMYPSQEIKLEQKVQKSKIDTTSAEFVEIITAIMKDRGFSQSLITISAADPRQLFRSLARGGTTISVEDVIMYLIDSRCPENLVNNVHFRSFLSMYSTTNDTVLNYNDFITLKDCKQNYSSVLDGTLNKKTTIQDETPLYSSLLSISQHFNKLNPHLSFHYAAQTVYAKNITSDKQYMTQVQLYNALRLGHVIISYDQVLFIFDKLNGKVPITGQADEDVVYLYPDDTGRSNNNANEEESLVVPLIYLPFSVVNAIIQDPLIYPLVQQAYTDETGQQYQAVTNKRTTDSNIAALNNSADLTKLMQELCLQDDKDQLQKKPLNPRFQSSLIEDMTDDAFNHHATHDLQQGSRMHFQNHVQTRKQLRTSIGFGNPTVKNSTMTDGVVTVEDADYIPKGKYQVPIDNDASKLNVNFGLDHGGKTPIKSREHYYPHAKQTYNLATATEDEHPNQQNGFNNTRRTTTSLFTDEQPDEYQDYMSSRPVNSRQFTSSVLKLRKTPLQQRPARQTMAPDSRVILGVQPELNFTPQKPLSGARLRTYPNRNQTAIQMQLETPGGEEKKSKYQRAPYDPEVSRQAIGHLDDGFQPADTPFLLRRQAKFSKLTQKEQVLLDEEKFSIDNENVNDERYQRMADMINPRDKSRRRTGYTNPNNVVDLMNLEISHPVYNVDSKFVADIDNALLNNEPISQYIIDNTNRSYKDLATRQLISVKGKNVDVDMEMIDATPQPTQQVLSDQEDVAVFTLDEDDNVKQESVVVDNTPQPQEEVIAAEEIVQPKNNNVEKIDDGKLTPEQLHDLNVQFTAASARIGKSREVFQKWSEYSGSITAALLHKALTAAEFTITLDNAQQLIDSVNAEAGGNLNLSAFLRLLGRGATD